MSNRFSMLLPDGTEQVLYEPTLKGLEYHSRSEPNVLLYGGRGSGKSTIGRWDAHMRAMSTPGFKYCILRRTFPELESSHFTTIVTEMQALGGSWNDTKHIARYPNGSLGFYRHCQNDKDVHNVLSAEFNLMFFDEISTFEWEMYAKLAASVRVTKNKGLTALVRAATNPLGLSAEMVNRYWITKDIEPEEDAYYKPDDYYAIKANLVDNPHLDAEQYKARFSGLSSHVIKAWVDGDFSVENALFDNFTPLRYDKTGKGRPYHVINELDIDKVIKAATIYRAIDAGWYPDPTVCLWIAHLGNRYIVFHEKIWFKTIAQDVAADIRAEDARFGITKVAMTYCDPSMDINTTADIRTIKEIYEANGIPMECSINDRELFATVMHQALSEEGGEDTPRIQFYVYGPKGCPYLARSIPQMRYHPKQYKKMDDHKNDHAVVACCYFLASHSADPHKELNFGTMVRKWMKPKDADKYVLGNTNVRRKD